MTIQGLRTSENFASNERPLNWRKGIMLRYPNGKAPLLGLTSAMKEESVDDPEFNWWEKELSSRRLAISASLTAPAADTSDTIAVVSGAFALKRGDMLWAEKSGEMIWVSADPVSDTSINVVRGYGGTTPAVVTFGTHNPNLAVIGSSYEEASNAPTGVDFDPTQLSNYTQIFRNTFEMSRTAQKTNLRTKEQVAEAKREVAELHSVDMERAFWFGSKAIKTVNGKPQRTTRGVLGSIDSGNIVDQAGTAVKMTDIEGWMERMFRFGSSEKMAFCGNRALLAINQAVRKNSTYNLQFNIKEYGMNVTRLVCPFGELVLKTHPLFNQMTSDLVGSPVYYSVDSWLWVLDMDYFTYIYLTDSDTKYQQELQDNGLDGMKSGWITECGLKVAHAKTHFLLKGLVSGVVDS